MMNGYNDGAPTVLRKMVADDEWPQRWRTYGAEEDRRECGRVNEGKMGERGMVACSDGVWNENWYRWIRRSCEAGATPLGLVRIFRDL